MMEEIDKIVDQLHAISEDRKAKEREKKLPPFVIQARQEAEENHLLGRPVDDDWIRKRALDLYEEYKEKNGIEADLGDTDPSENGVTSEWYSEEDAQRLVRTYKEKIDILENTKPKPVTYDTMDGNDREKLVVEMKNRYEEEIKDSLRASSRDGMKAYMDGIITMGFVMIANSVLNFFPDPWKVLAIIPFGIMFYRVHGVMKKFKKAFAEIDDKTKITPKNLSDSLDSSAGT